jgi:hypothetical protein
MKNMEKIISLLSIIITLSSSCTNTEEYQKLQDKVNRLERRVEKLENEKPNNGTPATTPTVVPSQVGCNLNNIRFKHRNAYADDYIRFINSSGNTVEFVGEIGAYNVSGTVQIEGNSLTVIKGNVTGRLTLLSNCQQLTGSLKDKGLDETLPVDFIKK